MRPVILKVLLVGFFSVSFMGLTGCGEKRIHVATVSGAPGEEKTPSGPESLDSSPSGTSGLPGTSVEESALTGENASTEEVQADAVLPVAPVEPLNFAHEPSIPAYSDDPSMQEPQFSTNTPSESESGTALAGDAEGLTPFANGKDFETQSNSDTLNSLHDQAEASPATTPAAGQNDLLGSQDDIQAIPENSRMAITEPSEGFQTEPSEGFQDDRSNLPGEINSNPSPEMFQNDPLNPQIVEQIPEKVQMAKAEPSDILRQQLDKIKEEELATASAGLEDVFFQFDSWTLTAEAKESLERDMGWLTNDPSSSLIIEGHADQRGTQAYNMVLGKKRAMAIRDYLSQLGVDPLRLTVISYGKDKPFCHDSTEVCHQLNRRGHLLVQN